MTTQNKKQYVTPRATNLSVKGALGASCSAGPSPIVPQGSCEDGSALTFGTCSSGGTPPGGNCSPYGFGPQRGYCDLGDKAVEGCTSGAGHF